MDRIIDIKVSGNYITKDSNFAGVNGEANVQSLRITFDESWDGYEKEVVFWNARGENPVKIVLTINLLEDITKSERVYIVDIPAEPFEFEGEMSFSINGIVGGKKQRSFDEKLKVKYSPETDEAGNAVPPTPTELQQIQLQFEECKGEIKGAVEAKEAIENMSVSVETLPTGSDVTVKKTETDGIVNLHFGVPRGIQGEQGDSAYAVAVKNGFEGTEQEWLESFPTGKSAYDYAVELGYEGTEEEYKAACEAQRILSIVQTVKSEESGGDNIWEATFGSGKTERFVVRNGVQGPKGDSSFSAEIKDGVLVVEGKHEVPESGVLYFQDNGGLIIFEGEANGSYSIAGGTTDKSLVENIAGSAAADLVDVNAAEANGELSISYGVDTITETAGTTAMGVATMAGAKGYYWHAIDFTNKTITLSKTRKATTRASATVPTNIDWAVGDYISIRNKDRGYGYCSKITNVNGNVITVDSLPFDEDLYTAIYDEILGHITYDAPYDRTIYAVYQEKYLGQSKIKRWKCRGGTVDLGFGAVSTGMQNAATGIFSSVKGRGNLAAGDYADAKGRVTIASGEASDAQGQRTKALGYAAHAEGTADSSTDEWVIASGDGAHAENYACHAIGHYSHSQGHRTRSLGNQSFTGGLGTVAVNATESVLGQYNIPTVQSFESKDRVYKGEWDSTIYYNKGDCVQYQGIFYLCNVANDAINPSTSTGSWVKFTGKTPSLNLLTIGNGSDDENRSNAFTLDVEGNGWFAGDVKVGVDNEVLATQTYVDDLVGDISAALDELHIYALNLIGGNA